MAEAKSQTVTRALILIMALWAGALAAWAGTLDWGTLSPEQQAMLAPWQGDWASFPAERRQALAALAAQHPGGSPQYHQLQAEIAHYAGMLEQERGRIMARFRQFKALPPEKQQEVMRQWLTYDSLPPEQKEMWRRQAQQAK